MSRFPRISGTGVHAHAACVLLAFTAFAALHAAPPHPKDNPGSSRMMKDAALADPLNVDWKKLPRVKSQVGVVFEGQKGVSGFNMHPYLVMHQDKYWAMWSSSPVDEDEAGQTILYATSEDGLTWSDAKPLTPPTPRGMRFIARGWWVRNAKLLALVSMDEAGPYFGPSLQLRAYEWSDAIKGFRFAQVVARDTINNFPPQRTRDGKWRMSRRDGRRHVYIMTGGDRALDRWTGVHIDPPTDGAQLEEPVWWTLPDGNLCAAFRDNRRSRRLYRSFSADNGATWSTPVRTDYPDATSKFHVERLYTGVYVLVSNPNPLQRSPLCLSLSKDGLVFDDVAVLIDDRTKPRFDGRAKHPGYQYPYALNFFNDLLVICSRNKEDIIVLKVPLSELKALMERP